MDVAARHRRRDNVVTLIPYPPTDALPPDRRETWILVHPDGICRNARIVVRCHAARGERFHCTWCKTRYEVYA